MNMTVVSVLPFALFEPKPGLIPDLYQIPRAKKGDISLLEVEDGYHYELVPYADAKMPPRRIRDDGKEIARSIIQDFISACLGVDHIPLENGAIPIPGLFSLEGSWDKLKIQIQRKDEINTALLNTTAWFERLIKIADDDWAKFHQYRFITDYQRAACNWLSLSREWNFTVFEANNSLCWACKKVVNPSALICQCGAILNMAEWEKKKDQFVNKT